MSKQALAMTNSRQNEQGITNIEPKNFFQQYGDSVMRSNIRGRLLKFVKGDWIAGQDGDELDDGTQLTVNMDSFSIGWIKWENNKPAQQILGPIVEGYKPPPRGEMGDLDPASWEIGNDGEPRDPWQGTSYVLMKPAGEPFDEDKLFTFSTTSGGGAGALRDLSKAYGDVMKQRPDVWPIVSLGQRPYEHKQFGRMKNPVFEIVGWEPKTLFEPGAEPVRTNNKKATGRANNKATSRR